MARLRRSRWLRPLRKFKRWVRRTPNGQIASTLIIVGCTLAFLLGAVAFSVL